MDENVKKIEVKASDYPSNFMNLANLFGGGLTTATTEMTISNAIDSKADTSKDELVPADVKTVLSVDDNNDTIRLDVYDNGKKKSSKVLMPDVNYFEVINDRVVIVHFCDGTSEKAVLSKNDTFSLEYGVSICITKKLLSMVSDGNGSSVYNKLVDYFMKEYNGQIEFEEWERQAEEEFKQREQKRIEKAKAKREKREQAMREEMIEIQKEAYIRAIRELNNGTPDQA